VSKVLDASNRDVRTDRRHPLMRDRWLTIIGDAVANHKDAIKRIKQNEVRRMRNRHYRSVMRNQIKRVRSAVKAGDKSTANAELSKAIGTIQRVAAKGIIHKNQAARRCSRLNAAVKQMA